VEREMNEPVLSGGGQELRNNRNKQRKRRNRFKAGNWVDAIFPLMERQHDDNPSHAAHLFL
jgi:hypothetical protein